MLEKKHERKKEVTKYIKTEQNNRKYAKIQDIIDQTPELKILEKYEKKIKKE